MRTAEQRRLKVRSQKIFVERCKEEGTCPSCGKENDQKERVFCSLCSEKRSQRQKTRHLKRKNSGRCIMCGKIAIKDKTRCKTCREGYIKNMRKHRLSRRLAALEAYGGCKCACCGLTGHHSFFALDHIDNDGSDHRKEIGVEAGSGFYDWLAQNKYPSLRLQVLCHSCNGSKHINGGVCAHERRKR